MTIATMSTSTIPAIVFACLASFLVAIVKGIGSKAATKAPKPPGPRRLPLIGSLLQMPSPTGKQAQWRVYKAWQQEYGTYTTPFCVVLTGEG